MTWGRAASPAATQDGSAVAPQLQARNLITKISNKSKLRDAKQLL